MNKTCKQYFNCEDIINLPAKSPSPPQFQGVSNDRKCAYFASNSRVIQGKKDKSYLLLCKATPFIKTIIM